MTTTTYDATIRRQINVGNLNLLAEALRAIRAGTMLSKIKVTFSGLTSAAAQDITTAAALAKATINSGITLAPDETGLPAIGQVVALRVTAGAAQAGPRVVTDAGGTAAAGATGLGGAGGGVALLSDDGKTLTFETTVTGFVLEYYPAPLVSLATIASLGAP